MPIVLIERLPLPSLRTYLSVSVGLLAFALFYAHHTVTASISNLPVPDDNVGKILHGDDYYIESSENVTLRSSGQYVYDVFSVLCEETWCIWIMINMAYCMLVLFGKLIQKMVFGKLRVSEQQHLKDKFWNFVFYKFIFVFGVMNIQNLNEVILWCSWFSVLGFLHLLAQLCKDRFEYLSFSPTTTAWVHAKVLMLLVAIQMVCACLVAISIFIGYFYVGLNVFAFMIAECSILIIRTFYVLVRYAIHLWDMNHDAVWENRAVYVYYTELIFELAALFVDFSHHLHMLVWGHIFLSMASLVIFMQLRYLFHEIQRRVRRHKNYLHVVSSMESKFTMASRQELDENNDDCAICWERMDQARRLPCGHLFHNACLRSWLEQDTSCPTCRTSLSDPNEQPLHRDGAAVNAQDNNNPAAPLPNPAINQMTNHFFHFDGSRYVSWLPSFSVEVMTTTQMLGNVLGGGQAQQAHTSQLDNMARQVLEVFPTMPMGMVVDSLRQTRSVELTIEAIIEGRLSQPAPTFVTASDNSVAPLPAPEVHDATTTRPASLMTTSAPVSSQSSHVLPTLGEATHASAPMLQASGSDDVVTGRRDADDAMGASGSRFSKSSAEREAMLSSRKQHLLQHARRRYLGAKESSQLSTSNPSPQPSASHSSVRHLQDE